MSVKTCAVCGGATYDADPIKLQTFDRVPVEVRMWLCSPECAWQAGTTTARHCVDRPTLSNLQALFKADGLEVLTPQVKLDEEF